MCSPQNEALVHEVVDEFVNDKKQFTAWDVTSEAKKRGADERHLHLKGAVHAKWGDLRNQGYRRQTIDIPNVSPPPWLYFPDGTDPQDYVNTLDVATDVDVDLDLQEAMDADDVDVDEDEEDEEATSTKPNGFVRSLVSSGKERARRITIPSKLVSQISANAGTKVFVHYHPNLPGLVVGKGGGTKPLAEYKVNQDGRVRIGEAVLKNGGFDQKSFQLIKDGALIRVQPV